jgi:lysophospholipase L1-like esterase
VRRRGSLALALVSLLVGLALAEALLRWLHPQPLGFSWPTRDGLQLHPPGHVGVYRRQEFATPVRINRMGFRGAEFAVPKPPGTFRVLALGDSFTEGMQVAERELVTSRLQDAFAGAEPRVEVLNLGVSGYGTDDELDVLARYGPELEPDLVLVFFFVGNDVRNNLVEGHCRLEQGALACAPLEPLRGLAGLRKRWRSFLGARSHLYQLWRAATDDPSHERRLAELQGPGALAPDLALAVDQHRPTPPEYLARGLELTGALLDAIRRQAEALGAPAWLVLIPSRAEVEDASWEELLRAAGGAGLSRDHPMRAVSREAEAAGMPVIDLLPAFLEHEARGDHLYFRIDEHFDADGHALAAAVVAAALRQAGIPGAASGVAGTAALP